MLLEGVGAQLINSGMASIPSDTLEQTQETDLWWGACSGWIMWPSFLVCGLISAILVAVMWYWDLPFGLDYVPVGIVWAVQIVRFFYCTLFRTYRLTTRRLLRDRGMFYSADGEIPIDKIKTVRVEQGPLETHLRIGRIAVESEVAAPMILEGVSRPERIATLIREAAQAARKS